MVVIRADHQSLMATVKGEQGFCPHLGVCVCVFTAWFTAALLTQIYGGS